MVLLITLALLVQRPTAPPPAAAAQAPTAAAGPTLERQVKAAYILNFIHFTRWPAAALGPAGTPFRVCATGASPLGGALEATMKGESVEGHPIVVERLAAETNPRQCHVLFASDGESPTPSEVLKSVANDPVLTVGESETFLRDGGILIFTIEQGRVRFDVNRQNAMRRGLDLSSRLLQVARSVR